VKAVAANAVRTSRVEGRGKNGAIAGILWGFVVAGVVTVVLGPILPVLISRWSMSDERAGLFFTVQFTSNLAGLASLSMLLPRQGYKFTLVLGFAAIALGMAGLNASSQFGGLAATALFGYGLGLVLSSSNLWVAEIAESRRVAALSILNFAWGVGAITCAPLVLMAQRHGAIAWFLYGVAGCAISAALILMMMDLGGPARKQETVETATPAASNMTAIALGALFYLYVGMESSVGGWAAALARRMGSAPKDLWALAPMFFYGGLLAGRAFVPVNPLRKRERALVAIGLIMGLVGSAVLLATRTFWGVAVFVGVAGLGFAAVYPVLLAWMTKYFGERARRVGNVLFALASLGGATMPWLVGFVSARTGNLRVGLLVPVAACLAMLGFLFLVPKRVTE
jgi:MFS transporter, FHS family, glucose/mannose:H+ symporter